MSINDEYIAVTEPLWEQFNSIYGPGTEIRRPFRITKSKALYVDDSLFKCDCLIVDYTMEDFDGRL